MTSSTVASESGSNDSLKSTTTKTSEASTKKEPTKSAEKREEDGFANPFEFVLTALGLAVGLGNIWRFPTRAFNNGGSAFLIPYIICAITFGLPAIYLEFLVGQYQRASPPIVFRRIKPILEGIGWGCAFVSTNVAIYYIVIIAWVGIYIVNLFRGHINIWNNCDNAWNNVSTCIDMVAQKQCRTSNPPGWNLTGTETHRPDEFIFLNGSCVDKSLHTGVKFISAPEQYLYVNIIQRSNGLLDINHINWQVFGSITICWVLTALLIWKGMKMLGKVSYITVVLPYILVVVLFVRGVTLEGASTGLYYYFLNPDYSKIMSPRTWSEALKQLCFSLSLGHGGLMSMASYNHPKSNCLLNAFIVIAGDTMMSVIGGAAVFSTLGFLANQRNVTVPEVVESGISLAFVVYPEALSQMPLPWLWAGLFFIMLFLLGMSSEYALTEVFCTCLYDQFPKLRTKKLLVVTLWCTLLYVIGLIFSSDAGFYWFELFDEFGAGFASVLSVTIEIIVLMYIYGHRHMKTDIVEIWGEARTKFGKYFGANSPYWRFNWMFMSPIIGGVLCGLCVWRDYPYNGDGVKYPPLFDYIGWFIALIPGSMIINFAIINMMRFQKAGYPLKTVFMLQKQHKSYPRISEGFTEKQKEDAKLLPEYEPWDVNNNNKRASLSDKSVEEGKSLKDNSKASVKSVKQELQDIRKDMKSMKEQIDDMKEELTMGPMATKSTSKN
ncbi:unnamed protein product [Caenorhabditis angaria]|uniref:Uncharacterized protein n=1 Tax=Caenorhabditis angaria TaxID=860376 RepID=A0A9P1IJV5_9PELO|nr:unnamed protein product [Caenorhabditis angaria]